MVTSDEGRLPKGFSEGEGMSEDIKKRVAELKAIVKNDINPAVRENEVLKELLGYDKLVWKETGKMTKNVDKGGGEEYPETVQVVERVPGIVDALLGPAPAPKQPSKKEKKDK